MSAETVSAALGPPRSYRPIIRKAAFAAGAAGAPGAFIPGLDVAAVSGVWIGMTAAIAKESGHELDRSFAAKLVASVTSSAAGYMGGSMVFGMLLHLLPGGSIVTVGINCTLNFLYTWRLGNGLAEMFSRSDFSANDALSVGKQLALLFAPIPTRSELVEIARIMRGSNEGAP